MMGFDQALGIVQADASTAIVGFESCRGFYPAVTHEQFSDLVGRNPGTIVRNGDLYVTFVFQMNPGIVTPTMSMIILGIAYPAIIGALVIDFRKVKPLIKAQQNSGSANKSPKQLKHEQEAREQAAAMEAARKAAKAAKRAPRRKKNTETIVPGGMPDDTDFKTGSGN